ncbi:MAG: histidine kinase, partial [Deltaproteobacteria bacterium]|nr:histidine kinase [Deltaproteobacteria bacterium]
LDCEKMEQAILNIVLNSIDAMPKGGRLEIAIGESEYEGRRMMRVDVTDTGIGMSPEQKKKIFDPFFTTKSTGVGLGLSNVKKIIEGHEGVIKVKSKVNEGTTFSFMLPTEQ